MDCSMPGFPVHRQLKEPTQTHVHQVSDAIQPLHPLLSPSPLGHSFFSAEQVYFNFMAAITICSDLQAQNNKVSHCFHCFPIYLP